MPIIVLDAGDGGTPPVIVTVTTSHQRLRNWKMRALGFLIFWLGRFL